jgi:hypothetical protein
MLAKGYTANHVNTHAKLVSMLPFAWPVAKIIMGYKGLAVIIVLSATTHTSTAVTT